MARKLTYRKENPRLVKRGDIVKIKGTNADEVVRDVSLVLHLANGQDIVFTKDEPVEIANDPDPSLTEAAAVLTAEDEGE